MVLVVYAELSIDQICQNIRCCLCNQVIIRIGFLTSCLLTAGERHVHKASLTDLLLMIDLPFNIKATRVLFQVFYQLASDTHNQGYVNVYISYPDLKVQHVLPAHPANCICIEFDPVGNYFATGSADALVSLWDVHELVCVRTLSR